MKTSARKRVIIENIKPQVDDGKFPVKRAVGEKVVVMADIFTDGHDALRSMLLYRKAGEKRWREVPMVFTVNDTWQGEFEVNEIGIYIYTIEAWVEHFGTWQKDLKKKYAAAQDVSVDILIGVKFMEDAVLRAKGHDKKRLLKLMEEIQRGSDHGSVQSALGEEVSGLVAAYPDRSFSTRSEKELEVVVDRRKALFSSWYERFPRSCGSVPDMHGTFKDCEMVLPEIARMGFDVFYLPPLHPIGKTHRKGKNNVAVAEFTDVGSPWAIGSPEGGHKAIHPELGTMLDFENLQKKARDYGIEIAMDIAFQCSPDHPYVKEHPEWFKWRPDGSVQYAENPPKKYEDIYPLNFETDNWEELWHELKSVFIFWIEKGIRIFRVDNPHTKSFRFWAWLIADVRKGYPEVIFLSEAFTRPKVMYYLAKLGFTQSYTYFTWRNTKQEFLEYLHELTRSDVREFFRPNFWPNTPDILPEHLQFGGKPAFMARLVLSATLSSNYGIYGPAFELCINQGIEGKEEYLYSEKYELKYWDWDSPGNLKDFIARVNMIRRENPALQTTWNLKFHEVDNEYMLFYSKTSDDLSNIILVIVNLDPFHTQSGWVRVPLEEMEIDTGHPYLAHDLLSDDKYIWHGERNYVELNPHIVPAHIFRIRKKLKTEHDFDYFM